MLSAFRNELAALDRFIDILKREQAALVSADVDRLNAVSQEKSRQADQLNQLARVRIAAFEQLGIGNARDSVENWLKSQSHEMTAAWNGLIETATTAQQLNQTNGNLIETQLQRTQQALNVLSSAANQSAVYGADGQTRGINPATPRILGKG